MCSGDKLTLNMENVKEIIVDSGEHKTRMLLWPLIVLLLSRSGAPVSYGCRSQRTSPGPRTLHRWPERLHRSFISFVNWKEPEPWPQSRAPLTGTPSKASGPPASPWSLHCIQPQDAPARSESSWNGKALFSPSLQDTYNTRLPN